jgi:glycolate oxidase iron-sulfur subunit
MSVCPIYRQTGREEMVARGKLVLIEHLLEKDGSGQERLSDFYRQAVDYCLLCHSCEENCSKNVKITEIIKAARREITAETGLHPVKKFLFAILPGKSSRFKTLIKVGSWLQLIAWRRLPAGSGLRRRLPIPLIDDQTVIPNLPRKNLDDRLGKRRTAPEKRHRLLYFPGCATRYLTPEVGMQTIMVLEKLDFETVVPESWACCGAVTEAAGDQKSADQLQEKNLRVMVAADDDLTLVVTGCATCGHTLKSYLLPEGIKVMDISEFLYEQREKLRKLLQGKTIKEKITYHDPCHLRKGQGITAQPRWLLRLITGDNFVELRHPERCCGSGGSFGVTHKSLSRQILAEKIADLRNSKARIIASGCPGCLIQLNEGIQNADLNVTTDHPITLLARLLS